MSKKFCGYRKSAFQQGLRDRSKHENHLADYITKKFVKITQFKRFTRVKMILERLVSAPNVFKSNFPALFSNFFRNDKSVGNFNLKTV